METIIKIAKAILDIWNIIKGVLNIFSRKKSEEANQQDKKDLEENIKDGDITDLNREAGWKK